MKNFMLGAMYWLNPNFGKAEIEEDMRRIKDNNFNIIRSFIWWEKVEAKEGVFDYRQHDILHEAAARYGIRIMETFGFYLPAWFQKRLVAAGIDDRDRRYACFDRPQVIAPLEIFIRKTVERYKDSPALLMWNLWNEPTKNPCRCPDTLKLFAAWLKKRYGTIEALRNAWLGEALVFGTLVPDSFEELTSEWLADAFEFGKRGRSTPMEYDWIEFSTDNLCANLAWLRDLTHSIDPVHETHANPNVPFGNPLCSGVNGWKMGRTLDSLGMSLHPSHFNFEFEKIVNFPVAESCGMDEIYSWTRGKDAWVTELQAGSTFTHLNRFTPSPAEISHDLLQAAGRGLRGVLFWEWQSWKSSVMEVGAFSLRRSCDGAPTPRSEAAKEAGRILEEAAPVLAQAKRLPSQVAILSSMASHTDKLLESRDKTYVPNLAREHGDAVYGCYRALNRANIPVEFVTELEIAEGKLADYQILYLPMVEAVGAETARRIEEFVRNGGRVWADGRLGFLDEHVFLRGAIPGHGLDKVFGCREADFIGARDNGDAKFPIFRQIQYLEPVGGEVIARHAGVPTVVENRYGKGTTELWGTLLTLGAVRGDINPDAIITRFALENGAIPAAEITPAGTFECCRLTGPEADVLVVSNRSATAGEAAIAVAEEFTRISSSVPEQPLREPGAIRCRFAPNETQLLILHRK